jgi:Flp pilus assembly protein TadG
LNTAVELKEPRMRRFLSDVKGNVAILFALATLPVMGAMGAAVDYSVANAQRTAMQASLDATALALARMMPLSQNELNQRGMDFFKANLGTTPINNVTLTIASSTGKLNLVAQGVYKPELVSVLGLNEFPINARAEAKWGIGKVEVALALDNTGSMASQGKITQLKIAAHNLLNTLQAAAATPSDAKVAIVPFNYQIKLSTAYRDASWMKYLTYSVNQLSQSGLTATQVKNSWQGCVTDRDQNHDVESGTPTTTARRFPGVYYPGQGRDCASIATVQFLTTDWSALHAKVDAMQADGYTSVTMGAMWGWHVLDPNMPFSGAQPFNTPNLQKFLILLTDGDNTRSRYVNWDQPPSMPNSTEVALMDSRTLLACTNAKLAGIKIYSIRVVEGNATLLRACASTPQMYYDVQNASELNAVFMAIGSQIANLHLSK